MFLSLILLFMEKYEPLFRFLPKDFWIISVLGSFIVLCANFTIYGKVTILKCLLTMICLTVGFGLNIVPCLYGLIINFPLKNRFSEWIKIHRYFLLFVFVLIFALINSAFILKPFTPMITLFDGGKNYERCVMMDSFGLFVLISIPFVDFTILTSILILVFIEWGIKEIRFETRCLLAVASLNIVYLAIFNILSYFSFRSYIVWHIISTCNYTLLSISNYLIIYCYRIFSLLMKNEEEDMYGSIMKEFQDNNERFNMSTTIKSAVVSESFEENKIKSDTNYNESTKMFTENDTFSRKNERISIHSTSSAKIMLLLLYNKSCI
ncbi:hypothetical protein BCR32DRAFT_273667 [Anaeromyces robustus]|nr:hypothetical protein BCR32DRAFT_273667 [Anaeromyces robustus]|eukprot:ORX42904.1 hypothetical protein BCR32DRAFT_273667 [Anaeromyces robustus]